MMDSKAAENVAPLDFAQSVPIRESEESRRGQVYHGAAGDKVANKGEKRVNAVTEQRSAYNATYQIAAFTKSVNSISKVRDQGNTVIFGSDGGVVVNIMTGEEFFHREHGVYVIPQRMCKEYISNYRKWLRKLCIYSMNINTSDEDNKHDTNYIGTRKLHL